MRRTVRISHQAHPRVHCVQEVLSHCLALHKDSQRRILELEGRLRQYGYKAEYSGRVVEDPLALLDSQPEVPDAHANVTCCMSTVRFSSMHKCLHMPAFAPVKPSYEHFMQSVKAM